MLSPSDCSSRFTAVEHGAMMWPHCSTIEEESMIKKLTKHGNSLALVIDRGVLDLLEIDAETPLNIKTDGKCLIVTPERDAARQRKFRAALAKVNRQYGPALKKLAE
jgi:antitoxin MazE